ncbi:protein translocase subunit SecD [Celerinatantimonas sp. MCCC 1A17872]|uniref:protein translocase subunit SecD n=1 Tax=Celerinatantimonas sp. MCCC 1A17872 TaxID=3177514 RepID=UPI0038C94D5D
MLNKYPWWKTLMVALVVIFGVIYALPNIYGDDPAVQISATRGHQVGLSQVDQVRKYLKDDQINARSVALNDHQILVRLRKDSDQLKTRDLLKNKLGDGYVVALNLAPATPEWLKVIGGAPLKLGLDLRGGVHFLMEVDMKAAVEKAREQMVQDFRADLRDQNIRYAGARIDANRGVVVRFRNSDARSKAEDYLSGHYRGRYQFVESTLDNAPVLIATMTDSELNETREYALQQNITIIRNRVNELGVAQPVVQRQGDDQIVVELPGIQDTARAKEILGATATLQFRMVNNNADPSQLANGHVPPGSELFYRSNGQPIALYKQVVLTGDHIVGAKTAFDQYNQPQVNIDLDSQGGSRMAAVTRTNVGKPMATLFIEYKPTHKKDAKGKTIFQKHTEVINVATIQSRLGRSFRITGLGSQSEAQNLALLLRAGALIAPIQIVEERTIGPSLGQENINRGIEAIAVGLIALIVFMPLYYRKFGMVANLALVCNVILIIGIMSLIPGATLTLPGMAGIVLTVGMAVDANVLIFERIREEMREGRSIQQSIHYGYNNALSSIADSNITTFLTSVILFSIGTGAVKGFAVTLGIGILTSMFTAIVGTRTVVNLIWGGRRRLNKLSI